MCIFIFIHFQLFSQFPLEFFFALVLVKFLQREEERQTRQRQGQRQRGIYFKGLAHVIVGAGTFEIHKADYQARNSGKS